MPGVQHPSGETEARFKSPPQVLGWARALQSVHFCPHCWSLERVRLTWVGSGGLSLP